LNRFLVNTYYYANAKSITLQWQNVLGWTCAASMDVGLVYGLDVGGFYEDGQLPKDFPRVFYSGFSSTLWALCLAWVTFSCAHGYGGEKIFLFFGSKNDIWINVSGIVNSILSWGPFQPLAKLSYVAYLIHLTVFVILMGYIRHSIFWSQFYMTNWTLAVFGIVMLLSLIAPS